MITKKRNESASSNRIAVSVFFFLAGLTFASWASRIPAFKEKFALSEASLGGVLFAIPIGLMISLLLAGALITRFGSKNVLVIAAIGYAATLVSIGFSATTSVLVGTLFFLGFFGNMFNVSVNAQAVGLEKLYNKSIMASFHGIWSLAGFTGAAIGTLMVKLGWLPWQHFLLVATVDLIAILVFASSTLPSAKEGKQGKTFVLPDKTLIRFGIIAFCCLVCEGTMFDWSGVYFQQAVGAPGPWITLGYSSFMACMAAGRFMADKWIMKFGANRMLQAAGIIIAGGLGLAIVFPNLVVATLGFMLVGFGVSSVVPIVYSLSGRSQTMNAGQAIAAVSTVGFAGFLAGPPIIGFIAEASNIQTSFAVVAIIGLGTTLLSLSLKK